DQPSTGRTAVFFVARLSSTRLPRKVLLPIAGKPLILQQMDRVRLAVRPQQFVLCTTDSPNDDELVATVEEYGIPVFRGPELDVPRRLMLAAEKFDVDHFVLVEADEHFVDPAHVDAVLDYIAQNGGDWVHVVGNPIGSWVRGISKHAVQTLCSEMKTEGLDGWGGFFEKQPERFKLAEIQLMSDDDAAFNETVRLTVDYLEDFQLAEELYKRLFRLGSPVRINDVVRTLRENPELININLYRQDQYMENIISKSAGLMGGH
ncbi:MAG: NTP transferase domain-containing protein, partial [Chthonomonadales bacterium]